MLATSDAAAEAAERTLVITRVFDAPRALVWQAWTDPDQMVRWMGPRGFCSKVLRMDARIGGSYHFYMRGPNNDDHWQVGVYREITPPERLSYTYAWADAQGRPTRPETVLTLILEEQGKQDQSDSVSSAVRLGHRARPPSRRMGSSLDRLSEYLAA